MTAVLCSAAMLPFLGSTVARWALCSAVSVAALSWWCAHPATAPLLPWASFGAFVAVLATDRTLGRTLLVSCDATLGACSGIALAAALSRLLGACTAPGAAALLFAQVLTLTLSYRPRTHSK